MNINDILNQYVKNELAKHRFYSEVGKVVSVDEDNMICEVSFISSNANKDVRLGSVISEDSTAKDSSSLIILPKIDTFVIVTFLNETTGFISQYSEVDKILYVISNKTVQIDETEITIQSGDRYIKLDDSFIEMDGNADFMVRFSELETGFNQLKSDFNSFVNTIYNVHVHPGVTAGAASTAPSPSTGSPSSADISGAKIDEIKTS